MEVTYSLAELSSLTGVPQRKIRYYIHERLVPKPLGKGRKSRYGKAHLATLQVIVPLREAHLPLDVIREYLSDYDPASVRASDQAPPTEGPESAGDDPLDAEAPPPESGATTGGPFHGLRGPQLAAAVLAFVAKKRESAATAIHKAAHRGGSQAGASRAGGEEPATVGDEPSTWQRFSLSPDVELHVRFSYLAARSADSQATSGDPLQTSEEALGIVLDALAATDETGGSHPPSGAPPQPGGEAQAAATPSPGAGAMHSAFSDTTTKVLVLSALVEAAAKRRTLRYADIASIMGIPPSGQSMGTKVGSLLDEICEDEVRLGRPMLSALVVGYSGRPGKGFFATAQALGRLKEGDDEAAFWARELEAVYEAWQSPAQPQSGSEDVLDEKYMTRERLLATAGEAAPVIEALLALEGVRGICLRPKKWCLSMRVEVDGDEVPMLNIFAAGVWFAPDCPCLYIDGKALRERRGQEFLDTVRARLAGDSSWRRMPVDAQCSLDHAFSEGEMRAVVEFVRWLRDQISKRGGGGQSRSGSSGSHSEGRAES